MEMKKRINLELRNQAPEEVSGRTRGGRGRPRCLPHRHQAGRGPASLPPLRRCRIWVSRGAGAGPGLWGGGLGVPPFGPRFSPPEVC